MDEIERDYLRRDVCDLIEEGAIECTRSISQNLLQMATSPKAHSCVQGVVERRFHPIHVRDFYSVINILLLQLLFLRQKVSREEDVSNSNSPSLHDSEAMKRRVSLLEKEVKESKKRYKELFKINQQWAKDYSELSKKLDDITSDTPNAHSPVSPPACVQCIQYTRELESKTGLIKDLSLNYEKVKMIQSGLETRLEESELERKQIASEYKALSLQLQELGGTTMLLRYKEERSDLIDEIRRLREKVTTVERERATLQTHLNRFRYSLRDLMTDSDWRQSGDSFYHTLPSNLSTLYPGNNTSSHGNTGYGLSHSMNRVKVPSEVFADSVGYSNPRTNGSGGPRRSSGDYRGRVVNPKQFAPLCTNIRSTLPTATGEYDYPSPQTPPGYLSRGDPFDDDGSSGYQENGKIPNQSPKYLNLPNRSESSNELPSPLSVPRPLSAPGSLFESTLPYNNGSVHNDTSGSGNVSQLNSPSSDSEVTAVINGYTKQQQHTPQPNNHQSSPGSPHPPIAHYASNPSIVLPVLIQNGGGNTDSVDSMENGTSTSSSPPQNETNWLNHVTKCTS